MSFPGHAFQGIHTANSKPCGSSSLRVFIFGFFVLYHSKKNFTQWNRVDYLLTEVVQSDKYHKSRAVSVMFMIGLTTDRDHSVMTVLRKHNVFYSSEVSEVTWYEPLFNTLINSISTIMSYLMSKPFLSYLPNPSARAEYDTRSIFLSEV